MSPPPLKGRYSGIYEETVLIIRPSIWNAKSPHTHNPVIKKKSIVIAEGFYHPLKESLCSCFSETSIPGVREALAPNFIGSYLLFKACKRKRRWGSLQRHLGQCQIRHSFVPPTLKTLPWSISGHKDMPPFPPAALASPVLQNRLLCQGWRA